MDFNRKCSKCGNLMKKIPIKRLDSTLIIEFYCDKCDESITFYPDIGEIKPGYDNLFYNMLF